MRNSTPDALSGLAPLMRVQPELQQLCRFGAQWASRHDAFEPRGWAPFHLVTHGSCQVDLIGVGRSIPLNSGDALLLPHGSPHVVRSVTTDPLDPDLPPIGTRSDGASLPVKFTADGDADPQTKLICGRLWFESGEHNLIVVALPEAIHVPAERAANSARLQHLVDLMKMELETSRPGATAIANDLASAFFSMVTRSYFEEQPPQAGLLALLRNPQTARAVSAMLGNPGHDWTLDDLASTAASSRASLVRAFQRVANIAPIAFLADLRLQLARHKLAATRASIADIAEQSGYLTEKNFVRAFKRRFALTPSEFRAMAQPAEPATGF